VKRINHIKYNDLKCIKHVGAAALLVLLLSGCQSSKPSSQSALGTVQKRTTDGFGDAALAPLNDLNVRRKGIPILLQDLDGPYQQMILDCDQIATEVRALTLILGPDMDLHNSSNESDPLSIRASEEFADYALDTVEGATTGFIPFRSVIRRATGAKAHEKALRMARETGMLRRAYLKGAGQALGCLPPAAPWPAIGLAIEDAPEASSEN
tara:strand:+ start:477 stop:1106 length:630 start_codon:yes stop_codon:yes gene_type:complete